MYPAGDEDIKKAIAYAKQQKVAIAMRSGGHSYCGSSSTNGFNIQIDMSGKAFKDIDDPQKYPYTTFAYNEDSSTITVGVGLRLEDVNQKLGPLGLFFPHGECSNVHVGGHAQTGGWGFLKRPFGLLADYIMSFDIVMADGVKRTVARDSTNPSDNELFFCVVGGSPGNFGALTHVTVRVLHDKDHPNARGLKLAWPYSKERVRNITQILGEHSDNPLAADFCFQVTVLGAEHFFSVFGHSYDKQMAERHSDLYGPNGEIHPLAVVAVGAVWANLGGAAQPYDDAVFKHVKDVLGTPLLPGLLGFDDTKARPISQILEDLTWKDVREFELPFVKKVWLTTSTNLATNGFADWVSDKVDAIEAPLLNGCKVVAQMSALGGDCAFRNKDGRTSAAWRDSTFYVELDVFYNSKAPFADRDPKQEAALWSTQCQDEAIGANGFFSKDDRRLIWAPHGVLNLDLEHGAYYDEATYQRLLKKKRAVDPEDVFTPNLFCVGATRKYRVTSA